LKTHVIEFSHRYNEVLTSDYNLVVDCNAVATDLCSSCDLIWKNVSYYYLLQFCLLRYRKKIFK